MDKINFGCVVKKLTTGNTNLENLQLLFQTKSCCTEEISGHKLEIKEILTFNETKNSRLCSKKQGPSDIFMSAFIIKNTHLFGHQAIRIIY